MSTILESADILAVSVPSGDVRLMVFAETDDPESIVAEANLSTSAARKLAAALIAAADAAEDAEKVQRRLDALATRKARLMAEILALESKAAELSTR